MLFYLNIQLQSLFAAVNNILTHLTDNARQYTLNAHTCAHRCVRRDRHQIIRRYFDLRLVDMRHSNTGTAIRKMQNRFRASGLVSIDGIRGSRNDLPIFLLTVADLFLNLSSCSFLLQR